MKKNFVFICLSLLQIRAFASDTTRIIGNIIGLKDSVIKLSIPILDSPKLYNIAVEDGKFEWKEFVAQPERTFIFMKEHYMRFYIDTGNALIKIDGNEDAIEDIKVTGSKPQDEYELYNKSVENEMNRFSELYNDSIYNAGHKDEAAETIWGNKRIEVLSEIDKKENEFIHAHPSSIVSLSLVEDMTHSKDFYFVDSRFKELSPYAQQTNAGKRITEKLIVLKRSAIGQPFIDFSEKDTSGKSIMLSDFKGKYIYYLIFGRVGVDLVAQKIRIF